MVSADVVSIYVVSADVTSAYGAASDMATASDDDSDFSDDELVSAVSDEGKTTGSDGSSD